MKAGDIEVPYEVYRYVALAHKDEYEAGKTDDIWLGESGEALLKELYADIDNTIATMVLPMIVAKEYGLSIDDAFIKDSVEHEMEIIYESYGYDYKAYTEDLALYHMNDGAKRFLVLNEVMTEELFHAMIREGDIESDEAVISDVFFGDEMIRVKQILVSSTNGNTEEENLKKAEELLARVNAGEDFDSLVQKEGQDLFMFNNEDGYYMMRGTYHKEFEKAAFALGAGEVSDIVKTPAGFSIIKRYEKEESYIKENFEDLKESYYDSVFNLLLEEMLPSVKLEKTKLYEKYTVFTLE